MSGARASIPFSSVHAQVRKSLDFKESRALAGLAVKLPAVFLPNKSAAERFFGFVTKNTGRPYYSGPAETFLTCFGGGV